MAHPWKSSQTFLALALLLGAAAGLARLQLAEGVRDRFLPGDPAIAGVEHEERLFGSAENLAILVDSDAPLVPDALLAELRVWRTELGRIPGVHSIATILDLPTVVWDSPTDWRVVAIEDARDPIASALAHPIARKTLLRRDGRGTAIVLETEAGSLARLAERRALYDELNGWTSRRTEGYRFTLAGTLPFQMAALDATRRDVLKICPPLAAGLIALLAWAFRSLRCALALLVVAVLAIAAAFGTFGHLGRPISQFNFIVAAVVFTVALLEAVHIAYGYCRARDEHPPDDAIAHALRELRVPCFWTSATTVAGFWALTTSSLPHVEQFGALAAAGTAWALVATFGVLPALLVRLDPRGSTRLRASVQRIASIESPRLVVGLTVVTMAVSAAGLGRIEVLPDFPRLFSASHPISRELARIENDWGGAATVSFLIGKRRDATNSAAAPARRDAAKSAPAPAVNGGEIGPEHIDRLGNFAGLLASRELVTSVVSPLDLISVAAAEYRRTFMAPLPRTELESAFGRLLSGDFNEEEKHALGRWVSADAGTMRVLARVRMSEPELFPKLAADLDGLRTGLADLFDVRLAGWPLVFKNMERRLFAELYGTFTWAFAVVALQLLIAFRSFRWWALALVPNVPPVWLALGALGLWGEPVSGGLLLAPGIAMGLIVDDTIHFIFALRDELRAAPEVAKASLRAVDRVGVPVLITSMVMFAGFAMLLLSEFRGYRLLGGMMMAIVVVAWLADVILTPAVLALMMRRGRAPRPA